MDCARPLPTNEQVSCDWRKALGARGVVGFCAKTGCHTPSTNAGRLNLQSKLDDGVSDDPFFISRLLNVQAAHKSITCEGSLTCDVDAKSCADCAMCPAEGTGSNVLIDTANPGAGWVFEKLAGFVPGVTNRGNITTIGCGDPMPTFNTTGTEDYNAEHKDCLIKFFTYIAKTPGTWPCGASGGSGGSGTGGASAAGAGGAGVGGAPMAGTGGS